MNTRWLCRTVGVGVLVLAAPIAARAQAPAPPPPPAPMGEVESGLRPASGVGVEFLVGGGYSNFTGSTARGYTAGAGTWDLRMVFGSRLPLGLEAAYVGSAQDLHVTGLSGGAYVLGNGGEGSIRGAIPIERGKWFIAPFATAGLGWTYYSLQNTNFNNSIVSSHDNTLKVPLSVGIDGIYQGFTMSARATWRPSFGDDMLGGADLSTWGISGNVGFEF